MYKDNLSYKYKMDEQQNQIEVKIPFKLRRKEYMREYQKTYMNTYYKDKMITCECNCKIFPHALKKHILTTKHKYLVLSKSS